jgi:hypothetical protein
MEKDYLDSVKKQFEYYKLLGNKTIDQLSEKELLWQYNSESNSIAIMVNHLWGNMMSRWSGFLDYDGQKDWRSRDLEFEIIIKSKKELIEKWEKGWQRLFDALNSINKENFETIIYIRNQGHTITEAINRQLSHYSYHVGQIVFVGRMIKGSDWKSLSIPEGKSSDYNNEKFSKEKSKIHFTDEALRKRKQ